MSRLFWQKARVLRNMIVGRPILTIFDVTKLCNERCPMCNIWKTTSNDMGLAAIEVKAKALAKFGIGYVFLQGGDPLMRKDIIEIIDIFLKYGIHPTVITNGILLTRERAEAIAARECNLAISIDSLIKERYAELRGVDALDKVKANIEAIAHLKGKHKGNWSITTTVTRMTELSDVEAMRAYAYEHGFMYAIRPYITVSGTAGKKDEKLTYSSDDVLGIFNWMLDKAREENIFAALIYEEHIKYIKGLSAAAGQNGGADGFMPMCDAAKRSFLMKETGEIAPCIEFPAKRLTLEHFGQDRKQCMAELERCNRESPCFYNDAREIGFLWQKKWRVLFHLPVVLRQIRRYGNFF